MFDTSPQLHKQHNTRSSDTRAHDLHFIIRIRLLDGVDHPKFEGHVTSNKVECQKYVRLKLKI